MAFRTLSLILLALSLLSAPAPAVDPSTLGPAVGQPLPPFEARDQHGQVRDFASLTGPSGLVLVFFRSADW
jgi:cytochrome oxidase Cu insertion factor (SCO1/SenC/PrrC family)